VHGVLVFAVTLMVAVLLSKLAARSILSTAVLFLLVGLLAGEDVLGWISLSPSDRIVSRFAELALFSVLFTDGMRVGVRDLTSAWRLPGRALLLGMPLTLIGTAALAHFVAGLSWGRSLLVGAVLSPTDPVFAAAIVGREEIPARLRYLLNIESGLNDGLALPIVMALLTALGATGVRPLELVGDLTLGALIGIGLPWLTSRFEGRRFLSVAGHYEPLYAFAVGLLVLCVAWESGANEYIAAYCAGMTLATVSPELGGEFHDFGRIVAEILKLAALLAFGALVSPDFLSGDISAGGYAFAFLALVAIRPIALEVSLLGSRLDRRERLVAAWFGPKGFASVVYALLILKSGVAGGLHLFHLIAVVIAGSMVAHSSTDVLIAQWFQRRSEAEKREGKAERMPAIP
jgi:NhaP-type Na+/H+ or K+/H+ antiporter